MNCWARVVIVAYQSGSNLQKCINALADQTFQDFEVVIVDNDSADGSVQSLKLPDERFSAIDAGYNSGFAGGCNIGAKGAKSKWIITLNPDAFLKADCLELMHSAAMRYPEFKLMSPLLVKAENPEIIDGCGDVLSAYGIAWRGGQFSHVSDAPKYFGSVFSPCGACAAYDRVQFLKIGGFDKQFFCYIEDIDLGLRFAREGFSCLYVPTAKVSHIGSATLGERHPFILYHSARNSIQMIVKNFPVTNLFIALPAYILANLWILLRNFKLPHNTAILKGLGVGLINSPKWLLQRVFNRLAGRSDRNLTIFTPLPLSRQALRRREICVKKLEY